MAWKKPFLKYLGNKYKVLDRIMPELEGHAVLHDVFGGSGSVSLNYGGRTVTYDANPDLVNIYKCVARVGSFSALADSFFVGGNVESIYYQRREDFNKRPLRGGMNAWRAAMFLYFNRHGYNGLCRYNLKGGFNVPFGKYKRPYFPADELEQWCLSMALPLHQFVCDDWRRVMKNAAAGDVAYFDPPYVSPDGGSKGFTAYNGVSFRWDDQVALAQAAGLLAQRGVKVVMSNHDTPAIRSVYEQFGVSRVESFQVGRSVSRNKDGRRPAQELLAVWEAR
mgnify:CR=1 FL=1